MNKNQYYSFPIGYIVHTHILCHRLYNDQIWDTCPTCGVGDIFTSKTTEEKFRQIS